MWKIHFLKQPNLSHLPGVSEPGIVVWKNMIAVFSGHLIELPTATLGEDNGRGRLYGSPISCIREATRTDYIPVPGKTGMKRQNHQ
jgi:hypothetical protein